MTSATATRPTKQNRQGKTGPTDQPIDRLLERLAPFLLTFTPDERMKYAPDAPLLLTLPPSLIALEQQPPLTTGLPIEALPIRVRGAIVGALVLNRRLLEAAIQDAYRDQVGDQVGQPLPEDMRAGAFDCLLRELDKHMGPWLARQLAFLPYSFWTANPDNLLELLETSSQEKLDLLLKIPRVLNTLQQILRSRGSSERRERIRKILKSWAAAKAGRPEKALNNRG